VSFYSIDSGGTTWRIDVNTDGTLQTTVVTNVSPTVLSDVSPVLTGAMIVKDALLNLGAIQSGEVLTAAAQADALRVLNRMLDSWNAEDLSLYSVAREELLLTAGHSPHTIGNGGDLNTVRPSRLQPGSAWLKLSDGAEIPLEVVSQERWAGITLKSTQGLPQYLYYDTNFATGNVYLYPVPDAAYTLVLYKPVALSQVNANTQFSLPPGYADAIVWSLTVRLAPQYGKAGSKEVADIAALAAGAKGIMKRANDRPVEMRCDDALLNCNYFDIRTGRIN
jgi:hypothetical protein